MICPMKHFVCYRMRKQVESRSSLKCSRVRSYISDSLVYETRLQCLMIQTLAEASLGKKSVEFFFLLRNGL